MVLDISILVILKECLVFTCAVAFPLCLCLAQQSFCYGVAHINMSWLKCGTLLCRQQHLDACLPSWLMA